MTGCHDTARKANRVRGGRAVCAPHVVYRMQYMPNGSVTFPGVLLGAACIAVLKDVSASPKTAEEKDLSVECCVTRDLCIDSL